MLPAVPRQTLPQERIVSTLEIIADVQTYRYVVGMRLHIRLVEPDIAMRPK